MPANNVPSPKWLADAEETDYPAAESYLSLIYVNGRVTQLIAELRTSITVRFKAKDIFRASGLSLLGISNSHVERDREKVAQSEALSPLLLVRDPGNGKVVIADGYHRLCAVYSIAEDALIPCRIA